MRVIKFQFLYKGLPFSSTNSDFNWHKKVYTLDDFVTDSLCVLSDIHASCELIAKRQFTGLTDKNGVDIYESDVVRWESANINMLIEWSDADCALVLSNINNKSGAMMNQDYLLNYKVIGNIYESPELVKD